MKNLITLVFAILSISFFAQTNTFPSSGNVGIGTTNPRGKLDVNGHIFWKHSRLSPDQGGAIELRGNATTPYIDFSNDLSIDYDARFILRGNDKLSLEGANLGIGTANPRGRLDVNGSILWSHSMLTTDQGGSIKLRGNNTTPYIDFSNDLATGYDARFILTGNDKLSLHGANLGIGTKNPDEKLTVKGKIHTEEVRVDLAVPADYVFQHYYNGSSTLKEDYTMPTLEEVEAFTKKNKHLPAIPSAAQIQKEGLHLKEMTNLLLQKIEELTIYTIEQEKRIKTLEAKLLKSK